MRSLTNRHRCSDHFPPSSGSDRRPRRLGSSSPGAVRHAHACTMAGARRARHSRAGGGHVGVNTAGRMLWAGGIVEHRAGSQPRGTVLAVARHANARRQVAGSRRGSVPGDCGSVRTGLKTWYVWPGSAVSRCCSRRAPCDASLRLVHACDRRYGFLESCRAMEAVAWYTRSHGDAHGAPARCGACSGDSNPEEVGFIAAARALWHSAGLRRTCVSDTVLTATQLHALHSRRATGRGRAPAQGTDHGCRPSGGHGRRIGASGSTTYRAPESRHRHLSAEGTLMDDTCRDH